MGKAERTDRSASPLIAYGAQSPIADLLADLNAAGLRSLTVTQPAELAEHNPAVVVLDAGLLAEIEFGTWRKYSPESVFVAGSELDVDADLLLDPGAGSASTAKLLRLACQQWLLARQNHELRRSHERARDSVARLTDVGITLSSARTLGELLNKVLDEAQDLVSIDAVSLYLVDRSTQPAELVFKLTRNDSVDFPFAEQRFAIDNDSIAGYVTNHASELNVPDVYAIPEDAPYRFKYDFDDRAGYRSVSMLALPMLNHRKDVVGVLQFINRKRERGARLTSPEIALRETLPFDEAAARLLRGLASQSAVAIENNRLLRQITELFEGFVGASVAAIEQRDPTTSGHSFRVADLCEGLALALPKSNYSRFKHEHFNRKQLRQLRYAALLHDFGKVGVREHVLVKARKLYDHDLRDVKRRIALTRERLQRQAVESLVAAHAGGQWNAGLEREIQQRLQQELRRLDDYLKAILEANEPKVLPEEGHGYLQEIHQYPFAALESGDPETLLSPDEFRALSIPKGSLSREERQEIENHVTHTVAFLKRIPWPPELRDIPRIAGAHHEKLDGSGYPHRKRAEEIPLPSKIMTICDIFDALVASDRPYKRAMKPDIAHRILEDEARKGLLDDLAVKVFIEAKVHKSIEGKEYPRATQMGDLTFHHHVCDFDLHRDLDDDAGLR